MTKTTRARSPFAPIEEAVAAFRDGRMIIVCDDEDRENEGDLTVAAEKVTPEIINFMFESLSNRLQDVFRQIRGEGRLTEETVELALREIRMALLEADVNFKVVKAFIDRVRDRSVDQEVLKSLTPDQQVVRIVRDEMLALFGDAQGGLPASGERPRVIMKETGKKQTSA